MTSMTSAGSSLEVSATLPATYDQAGFEALTFTNIGEITSVGEYGRTYEKVTHNPLDKRNTVKRKGNYDEGALSMQMARDPSDAGQAILITARDDDASYAFKVTLQDGTVNYFTGQVMSYTTNVGSGNQITGSSVSIEIDNDVVEVAA